MMLTVHIGSDPSRPIWVAIKGVIFDVSKNKAYQPGGSYNSAFSATPIATNTNRVWL